MTQDVRKKITPDWDTWGGAPIVQLWEAVALSLGIDPEQLRVASVGASTLLSEFAAPTDKPDFRKRLSVAERNITTGLRNAVATWPEGGLSLRDERYFAHGAFMILKRSEVLVNLTKFVAWSRSIKWEIPSELDDESVASTTSWPWGNYSTKWLEHLDAAVRKFWSHYDPHDPSSAPTKDDVVSWLRDRGVSQGVARSMDTIIRAEGLPAGPRKPRRATKMS